jgi:hypothetical protein
MPGSLSSSIGASAFSVTALRDPPFGRTDGSRRNLLFIRRRCAQAWPTSITRSTAAFFLEKPNDRLLFELTLVDRRLHFRASAPPHAGVHEWSAPALVSHRSDIAAGGMAPDSGWRRDRRRFDRRM